MTAKKKEDALPSMRNVFFIVPARNRRNVEGKIVELAEMNVPYVIACGEPVSHSSVVYREPRGKWDAINFSVQFVPKTAEVIVLNDVDTRIHNFGHALHHLNAGADLVYCRVNVCAGPQVKFYKILDPIRTRFHVAASGELMLMKRRLFERVLPAPPCVAEDSYILFKGLELGCRVHFCSKAHVRTERTVDATREEAYKARTTVGIYHALQYTRPPPWIIAFYTLLPVAAPLLGLAGKDGRAWAKGIEKGVAAHIARNYPTSF
jgi:hypothetical protein